jgi:arginyl-tRNA--protein-N-Asp/Glu arginylyltransferase
MVDECLIKHKMCKIIQRLKRRISANERLILRSQRKLSRQAAFIRACSMQNEKYAANSRYALSVHTNRAVSMPGGVVCTTTHFPYYPYEIH